MFHDERVESRFRLVSGWVMGHVGAKTLLYPLSPAPFSRYHLRLYLLQGDRRKRRSVIIYLLVAIGTSNYTMYSHQPLASASNNSNLPTNHNHYAISCHKNEADRIRDALLQAADVWTYLSNMPNSANNSKSSELPYSLDERCVIVPLSEEKGRRKDRQGYKLMILLGAAMSPAHLMHMARRQISWAGRLSHKTTTIHTINQEKYNIQSIISSVGTEIWKQLVSGHGFDKDNDSLRVDVQPKHCTAEFCNALQQAAESLESRNKNIALSQDGPVKLTHSATKARNVVSIVVHSILLSMQDEQSTPSYEVYWGISTSKQHWKDLNQRMNDNATKEIILETTDSVTGLDLAKYAVSTEIPVSRAYYKLAQIFEDRDNLRMLSNHDVSIDKLLSHGSGLDIGASPGGWTQVMHTKLDMETIVAVDPGVIAQRVAILPGVHHIRHDISSQEAIQNIAMHVPYSLIVCDACVGVEALFEKIVESLQGVVSLLKGSKQIFTWPLCLVVTLKFPDKTSGSIDRHLDRSKQIISGFLNQIASLGSDCDNIDRKFKIFHLFANSVAERTMIAVFNKRR